MVSLSRVFVGISLLSLSLLGAGCGKSFETHKVKNYSLALVQGDSYFKAEFKTLVADFNKRAGLDVLTFEDDAADANSPIIMTHGLKASTPDNNVGFGQWLSESKSDNPMTVSPGTKPQRTVTYSMRVEFDWEYFQSALGDDKPQNIYKKEKLFFHEVGHGLEMVHNTNEEHDVMYPDVGRGDEKDFDGFFDRVRSYMADRD